MRISTNDLRGYIGTATFATINPVSPLAPAGSQPQSHAPARPPVERVLEGELLRQNPVVAVESILSDARTVLFARAQIIPPEPSPDTTPTLAPFATLFYQQHSSPENLSAGRPGQHINQFV